MFLRGLGEHVRGDGDGLLSAAGLEMVGGLQVRKIRGPLLDLLYAQLRR